MKIPYEHTTIPPERTKAEIEKLLKEHGITDIQWTSYRGETALRFLWHLTVKGVEKEIINTERPGYCQPFKDSVYRKIDPDKPLFTICSQRIGNERYLLPNGTSLEVSELAQLQGCPNDWVFPCSRSEAQRQLGNSVSPPVAKAIALRIKEYF